MSDYRERTKRGEELQKKMGRDGLLLNQKKALPDLYEMSAAWKKD